MEPFSYQFKDTEYIFRRKSSQIKRSPSSSTPSDQQHLSYLTRISKFLCTPPILKMQPFAYLLLAIPLLASCAPSRPHDNLGRRQDNVPAPSGTSSTPSTSTTSCAAITTPTKAYTVIAARSGSPIHLLPMEAGGLGFHLGGGTSSYCPQVVGPSCPPGNQTVFVGGSISVMVPGGQQQYTEVGGRVGYTQAHSAYVPSGAIPGGFSYSKCPGEQFGHITTNVFGATGLMACPDSSSGTTRYVVFASIPNAVVPSGNVKDCFGFDALTTDYDGPLPAAWQYT